MVFIYLLAVLGLHWCTGFFLVATSRGYSPVVAWGFLIVVASHCRGQALRGVGFSSCSFQALEHRWYDNIVMVHGLNCSMARGIFPDQELNSCLLHWQADSLPVSHQGGLPLGLIWPYCQGQQSNSWHEGSIRHTWAALPLSFKCPCPSSCSSDALCNDTWWAVPVHRPTVTSLAWSSSPCPPPGLITACRVGLDTPSVRTDRWYLLCSQLPQAGSCPSAFQLKEVGLHHLEMQTVLLWFLGVLRWLPHMHFHWEVLRGLDKDLLGWRVGLGPLCYTCWEKLPILGACRCRCACVCVCTHTHVHRPHTETPSLCRNPGANLQAGNKQEKTGPPGRLIQKQFSCRFWCVSTTPENGWMYFVDLQDVF